MMFARGFFDLCVPQKCFEEKNGESTLKLLYDYGYRTIAINHEAIEAPGDENENKKKKKKGQAIKKTELVPEPVKVDIPEQFDNFTILKRLTITFSSSDSYDKFKRSPNFKKYDILALLPTTVTALNFTCVHVDADILAMDPASTVRLKMNRGLYNQLLNRGFFFEILYGSTIEDSTKRKNTISQSHIYHTFGKSKNIILSSGASDDLYIRSPYDVINLGPIFGLNTQQSKYSITHYPSFLCKKAYGRCHGKTVMFVENIEKEDDSVIELVDSDVEMLPSPKKHKA